MAGQRALASPLDHAVALLRPLYGRASEDPAFPMLSAPAQWQRLLHILALDDPDAAIRLQGWAPDAVAVALDRLRAPPAAPAATLLWRFQREVTCRAVRRHDGGWDLRIDRDGEMYMTELHRDEEILRARANQLRLMMRAKGWKGMEES